MLQFMTKLFNPRQPDPLLESLLRVKSLRVVGRGGLAQDASEVYESESFKKAQRDAVQIFRKQD